MQFQLYLLAVMHGVVNSAFTYSWGELKLKCLSYVYICQICN